MDKIINFFKQWDKLAHTAVSALIMVWFTCLGTLFFSNWIALLFGSAVTLLCGFAKEGMDSSKEGNYFSTADFLADVIGLLVVGIPLILFCI